MMSLRGSRAYLAHKALAVEYWTPAPSQDGQYSASEQGRVMYMYMYMLYIILQLLCYVLYCPFTLYREWRVFVVY